LSRTIALPLESLGWTPELAESFRPYADDGLAAGRVALQHRGAYVLYTEAGELPVELPGRMLHEAEGAADLPAVGDWVAFRPLPGEDRGLVQAVLPRRTKFSRKTTDRAAEEQVLAANVDVVFLVSALTAVDLNPRRLERYLATAWESGADPVVVLTKSDLCDDLPAALAEVEGVTFGVPVEVVSNVTGEGVDGLRRFLSGNRTVALLGSSGVGKSSLVNRLLGAETMAVRALGIDGKGRHTTSHRELLAVPGGGLVLDTPGMRELQLWEAESGVETAFDDVEEIAARCRFNDCSHGREPGCAIKAALEDGTLAWERYDSYRHLQRELAALEQRHDKRLQAEARKRWRALTRERRNAAR
jgi:ribosome biogenesis GTPase